MLRLITGTYQSTSSWETCTSQTKRFADSAKGRTIVQSMCCVIAEALVDLEEVGLEINKSKTYYMPNSTVIYDKIILEARPITYI